MDFSLNYLLLSRIVHELMHAAGFWHEQSRPDRDDHVKILWKNIANKKDHMNFKKIALADMNMVGQYDPCSVMHYGQWDYSKGGKKTIMLLHNDYDCRKQEIGSADTFTREDIRKLNAYYSCPDKNRRGNIHIICSGHKNLC